MILAIYSIIMSQQSLLQILSITKGLSLNDPKEKKIKSEKGKTKKKIIKEKSRPNTLEVKW